MASKLTDTFKSAQAAVMSSSQGAKLADLQRDMKEPTDKTTLTSDFGVPQTNNDDWLKVYSEDKQGPFLMEDNFGREKVCIIDLRHASPPS